MITRIDTGARSSRIVIHNDTVYLSGQVAEDSSADLATQTQSTLSRVEKALTDAGSNKEQILSATIYLRDIKDFAAMNEVWNAWVPEGHAPARACVEARMARQELLVEICVIAAK